MALSVIYEEEPGPGAEDEARALLALSKDFIKKMAINGLQ